MTPEFAKAVDPIFLYVLNLQERLERSENPSAEDEQDHTVHLIEKAEAELGGGEEWLLAKYGLAAWIDEMLVQVPWSGQTWWNEHKLEFRFFRTSDYYRQFYIKAQEAGQMNTRDALEVFYVCVVLGFRGLYQHDQTQAAVEASQYSLPPSLESWAEQTVKRIHLRQGRPKVHDIGEFGEGAPPRDGESFLTNAAVVCAVLAAATVVLGVITIYPLIK